MEYISYIKNVKVTTKKLRFLLDDVRKMDPYKALEHLYYTPKKSAKILYSAIKSAIDSAKNMSKDMTSLKFKTLLVEEGRKLKRFKAGGRGTPKQIIRRSSHIKVILVSANKEVKSSTLSSSRKRGSVDSRSSREWHLFFK